MRHKSNTASLFLLLAVLISACGGQGAGPRDTADGPDLVVRQLTVDPAGAAPGSTVTVAFTVVNQGDEAAAASTARISLGSSVDATAADDELLIDIETPELAAGATHVASEQVDLPEVEEGEYFIRVTADINREAGQSDHSNDTATVRLTLFTDSSSPACTEADQVIDIPDAKLAVQVRLALGLAAGAAVECQEMWGLTSLTVHNAGVLSVEGLQHAVNLTELVLNSNSITDLAPLASLSKLSSLALWGNEIRSITSLANLTELTELQLGFNSITDLSPLANLTQLEWLEAGGNQISDLAALKGLVSLEELSLSSNQISNLSPLMPLTAITWIRLDDNRISDLEPLAALSNLADLDLDENQITDLDPLAEMTQLTKLRLNDNQITDLEPLADLINLEVLEFDDNHVADIGPLVRNTGIGQDDSLSMLHNCLDLTEGSSALADIQTLLDRGASIWFSSQRDCPGT